MDTKSITVCIVNYNSSDFTLNTLYCLDKLTKNKYKVIIRDNNSKLKDFLKLKRNIQNYSNVELYRVENFNYTPSMAHAIGINDLVKKIDTIYGVIMDADCTLLYKNWDEILINQINDEYPIIGTQISIRNGIKLRGIGDFPIMFTILFKTEIMKKLNIDFRPKNNGDLKDTGHELRKKYLENGYKGKLLMSKNTRDFKLGPFNKVICVEYYLNGYEEIFACHFSRGSSLGIPKYLHTKKKRLYTIPKIGYILLKLRGIREKKRWIKICKKIVANL